MRNLPESLVILRVGVPSYRNNVLDSASIKAFEEAYPGTSVKVVVNCNICTHEGHSHEGSFDIDFRHAQAADVLVASGFHVSDTLMRAGYFRDLTSLAEIDSLAADYYPV